MNFFYVINSRTLKQLSLILITAFFTAFLLYMENMVNLPVFSTDNGPKVVYRGEKDVALTFDIGWGDEKAEPILKLLKQENVRSATFFLAGSWAERHPDVVEEIKKSGYEIGMLGYNYVDYTALDVPKIKQDILKAQEIFNKLNIKNIKLLRAPTGHFDEKTLKVAEQYGYTVVHWSVDSQDWTNPGAAKIIENVDAAKKGDIVLLHASDSAKQTAQALPQILKDLKGKGLKLVTVSEMIANGNVQSSEIK